MCYMGGDLIVGSYVRVERPDSGSAAGAKVNGFTWVKGMDPYDKKVGKVVYADLAGVLLSFNGKHCEFWFPEEWLVPVDFSSYFRDGVLDLSVVLCGLEGIVLWCPMMGAVRLQSLGSDMSDRYPIECVVPGSDTCVLFMRDGRVSSWDDAECVLFPSATCRDWFTWLGNLILGKK